MPPLRSWSRTCSRPCMLAPGIGLAATQVDFHKRLIVMDVSEGKNEPLVFCNPEILAARRRGDDRGRLPVGAGHLRRSETRRHDPRARPGRQRDQPSRSNSMGSPPSVCSTRWTTSKANSSSTTCPISSASASARSSTRIARNAPANRARPHPRARTDPAHDLKAFGRAHDLVTNRLRGHTAIRAARAAGVAQIARTASSAC